MLKRVEASQESLHRWSSQQVTLPLLQFKK